MHHPVGGVVVGRGDLGAVDQDSAACDPDRHILALHGLEHVHVHQILGVDISRGHVVREKIDELGLVLRLEQIGQRVRRKSGKRLVCWGKYGERAR